MMKKKKGKGKRTKRTKPKHGVFHQSLMEAEWTSTSSATTTHKSPLQLIQQRIVSLQNKYLEKQLKDGGSLDQQQKQCHSLSKLCILIRLEELHNLKKRAFGGLVSPEPDLVIHNKEEATSGVLADFKNLLVSGPHSVNANTMYNEEEVASVGVVEDLGNLQMPQTRMPIQMGNCVCSFQKRSSLNESGEIINQDVPFEKERYLCVSDGFVIYIFDLKRDKDVPEDYCSELPPLPTIDTFNLLENGLPTTMGLFKLGLDVYMVGGQEFPGFNKQSDPNKYGFNGSSRGFYHLSIVNGHLSLSLCNHIPLLNKTKLWPIVEKIGNKVHVIESIPYCLSWPGTIPPSHEVLNLDHLDHIPPSHEVLNLDHLDQGWSNISPMCYHGWSNLSGMCYPNNEDEELDMFICDHLVVGEHIYGKAHDDLDGPNPQVFDSKTNIWESHVGSSSKNAIYDFRFAKGICVGEFLNGEFREPMYVIIGIKYVVIDAPRKKDDWREMIAEAYLVNGAGHIFSTQKLPNFFQGLKVPSFIRVASLFRVDEEGTKKNMCAVVLGTDLVTWDEFLYICTFSVEAVACEPRSRVSLLFPEWDEDAAEIPYPVPKDFVNLVVKNRHVYTVGTEFRPEGGLPPRISACFM